MKPTPVSLLSLLVISFATRVLADQPPPGPFRIIVNPKNPVSVVDRMFLRDAFLKKKTKWPSDKTLQPVDLPPKSDVRGRFSSDVLGRPISAVRAYWQQRIFSGTDIPPPERESDETVVNYVLQHEGAVGYVSGRASLNGSKVVAVAP
jgi:ABC-type phosphate transport system substrate-binding protein